MDVHLVAGRMEAHAEMIRGAVAGVDDVQARWQPAPGRWSVLQVLRHLRHEEGKDFRFWLDHLLRHPELPCPPLQPAPDTSAWNRGTLAEALAEFLEARRASATWVRTLAPRDWGVSYREPDFQVPAGDFLASWLGHDLVHVRQILRLRWEHLPVGMAPHRPSYNADW